MTRRAVDGVRRVTLDLPPCADEPELFESLHIADHLRAKAICDNQCPVKAWCRAELDQAIRNAIQGWGPQGTWAGEFVGSKKGLGAKPKRSVAACGTESGYKRHKRHGEDACEECLQALREARAASS